jgi:rubrerythrin
MKQWKSIDEALDFAIKSEERAANFYTNLAKRAETSGMREVFEGFSREELGHKAKLEAIKGGDIEIPTPQKIQDLKISDYTVEVEADGDLSYQDSLILAMKREKAAYRLYSDLAAMAEDTKLRQVFFALAQEEANHKLRFEIEYDENVYTEN